MPFRPALLICLGLMACSDTPNIGPVATDAATATPVILPLDALLASVALDGTANADGTALAARAAALRARAAAMRGPVNDPATRERLAAAIAQGM